MTGFIVIALAICTVLVLIFHAVAWQDGHGVGFRFWSWIAGINLGVTIALYVMLFRSVFG